jgi:hypothetical protein
MRRIALVATLLLAGAAHGQTLYKCVSRNMTSYQQTPCPPNARTVRSFQTVPEPLPTAAQRAERRQQAQEDRAESAFLSHLAGTDQPRATGVPAYRLSSRVATRDKQQSPCDAAKRGRAYTLRTVGLHRNLDLLRRLDDDVAEACRQ